MLGDFSQYLMIEPQPSSALSIHIKFLTDEVAPALFRNCVRYPFLVLIWPTGDLGIFLIEFFAVSSFV